MIVSFRDQPGGWWECFFTLEEADGASESEVGLVERAAILSPDSEVDLLDLLEGLKAWRRMRRSSSPSRGSTREEPTFTPSTSERSSPRLESIRRKT